MTKVVIINTPLTQCAGVKMPTKKRNSAEHDLQSAFFRWFNMQYKNVIAFRIENGHKRSFAQANYAKAEGMRAGVLDVFIAKPNSKYAGLFIEFKIKPNVPTDKQKQFIIDACEAGYQCAVVYDLDTALKVTKNYFKD